jgi:2-keto-3-deoxy-6-phosphogluconate aldolase
MFSGKGDPLCRKVRGMLSEFIDNSLNSENKSLVERHLQTCEACSKELESLRMTVQLLHRVSEVPAPRSFTVTVPPPRRESAFGPASLRWLRPATAIVAIALVVLLMGDFLHAFENNAGVDRGAGNVTFSAVQSVPSSAAEKQTMVTVPGVMGQMSLATAKAVGYTDYTIVPSSTASEQQTMVAVPGVMGQMSLATAKAVGYKDYTVLSSSAVSQPVAQPVPSVPGNEEITGGGVMAQGEAGVGWPLRQTEIGLGAAVFVLLALIIFARRQRTKGVGAR